MADNTCQWNFLQELIESSQKPYMKTSSQKKKILLKNTEKSSVDSEKKEPRKSCKMLKLLTRMIEMQQCNRIGASQKYQMGMKEYIRKGTGSLIQQVIKIRLNMTDQKINFRNKYGENLNCPFVM